MNIHWIQHVPFEGLGGIEPWVVSRGHSLSASRMYASDPLPALDAIHWLIVMGGPMNIYEEAAYPWLAPEKDFIKRAIGSGKVVVGICLGAQLIADALGSRVYTGRHKEIGWFPVRKTEKAEESGLFKGFPSELDVFHWHGDTFDVPPGCLHLAESEACPSQAFVCEDRVLGLQFHLEMTRPDTEEILAHCRGELVEAPYIQSAGEIVANPDKFAAANREMVRLLNRLSLLHA
jgi:GMP synthase-like glutamine amidotransferase